MEDDEEDEPTTWNDLWGVPEENPLSRMLEEDQQIQRLYLARELSDSKGKKTTFDREE